MPGGHADDWQQRGVVFPQRRLRGLVGGRADHGEDRRIVAEPRGDLGRDRRIARVVDGLDPHGERGVAARVELRDSQAQSAFLGPARHPLRSAEVAVQRDGVHRAARGRGGGTVVVVRAVVAGGRPPGPAPGRRQRERSASEQQETAPADRSGVLRRRRSAGLVRVVLGRSTRVRTRRGYRRVRGGQGVLDVRQGERGGRARGDQPGHCLGQPAFGLVVLRGGLG